MLAQKKAILALEDGTTVRGVGFGSCCESLGEVVFNTGMTGYPECLTDPSYNGQILMMTYPLIGNYNVHSDWMESRQIWAEGFIIREICEKPSHWAGNKTIDKFLREYNTPGIAEIDTRALTTKIREFGVMKGALVTYTGRQPNVQKLLKRAREQPSTSEIDLAAEASVPRAKKFNPDGKRHIVLLDYGVKMNMVRHMVNRGFAVTVVPAHTTAEKVEALEPNGIMVSNGPGDPAFIRYAHRTVKQLLPKYPTLGICLGHQLIALASGAKTFKLKFGHRGSNQPVKDLETGRVHITTQNHGFAVDPKSVKGTGFKVTKINGNDGTVEGISHSELPVISVQYHPEHCPGPHDNQYIFDQFARLVKN